MRTLLATLLALAVSCPSYAVITGVQAPASGAQTTVVGVLKARDATGLGLQDDGDNLGIHIQDGGAVGVGTTAPGAMLQLGGDAENTTGAIRFEGADGDEIDIAITANDELGITGGNVGIGNTNPTTALDVTGTVNATAFIGDVTGNADTATALAADPADCTNAYANAIAANGDLTCSADGSFLTGIPSTASISGVYLPLAGGTMTGEIDMGANAVKVSSISASGASGILFTDDGGNTGIFLEDGGKIGIGMTNPGALLEIIGAGSGDQLRIGSTAANYYKMGRNSPNGLFNIKGTQAGFTGYQFLSDDNSVLFHIADNGNVGIGTASPSTKLDVSGTVTATAFAGDGSALTGIPSTASISGVYLPLAGDTMTGALNMNGNSIIESGGDIGIGTTSPNSALDVNGTVTATQLLADDGKVETCASGQTLSGITVSSGIIVSGGACIDIGSGSGDAVLNATQTWSGGNSLYGSTTFYGQVNFTGGSSISISSHGFIPNTSGTFQSNTSLGPGIANSTRTLTTTFQARHLLTGMIDIRPGTVGNRNNCGILLNGALLDGMVDGIWTRSTGNHEIWQIYYVSPTPQPSGTYDYALTCANSGGNYRICDDVLESNTTYKCWFEVSTLP